MRSFFIYLFIIPYLSFGQFKGLPFIKNYSPQEYQGGMQNWWMIQDTLGNIYSANNSGVLRFDGTNWSLIEIASGKKTRSLDISKNGIVYVGGENELGYLKSDAKGVLHFSSLSHKLSKDYRSFEDVWRVLCVGEEVYFQTFNEVFLYSRDTIVPVKHHSNLSFGFKFGESVGISDYKEGLLYYTNGEWDQIPGGGFFKNMEISSVIWNGDGWLVSAVDEGLFKMGVDGTIKNWVGELNEIGHFTRDYVLKLSNGNVALATRNNGLIIFNPSGKIVDYFSKGRGLKSQAVLNVFEDREGNLWCGLNDGLSKIELAGSFTSLNEQIGIQGAGYNAYGDDSKLYLCARNGLFLMEANEVGMQSARLIGSETGQTYGVSGIGTDIFLAAHNGAYQVANKDSLVQISEQDGWWGFQPVPGKENHIIAGTYNGLFLLSKQSGGDQEIVKIEGFDESSRLMVFENHKTVWVSHGYKGAFRLTLSEDLRSITQIQHFGSENGFPSNTNINVRKVDEQLIFTSSKGIFTFDYLNGRIVPFKPFKEHFQNSTIYDFSVDDFRNVYFIGKNEVGLLRRNFEGTYTKEVSIFGKIRPLLNDDFPFVQVIDDKNVLFGAKEGFIHFDPTSVAFQIAPQKVQITRLSLASPDSTIADSFFFQENPKFKFEFPFTQRSIRINYSAPYFSSPITYSTQMEGVNDNQWSEWSEESFREFSSLREGTYTFRVKSRTSANVESKVTELTIKITPPWYRAKWFKVLIVTLSVSFLSALFINQKSRHKNETEDMMISQQAELNQKDSILKEISNKSQVEIQRLENEKSVIALEHKSRELASSTMNLLQKNEIMKKIMSDLTSLKQNVEKKNIQPTKELLRIIKNIDRSMNSDKDWNTFQMYFDEVHGDFSKKLRDAHPQITPMELKLCTFIRLNMSSKDVANLLTQLEN